MKNRVAYKKFVILTNFRFIKKRIGRLCGTYVTFRQAVCSALLTKSCFAEPDGNHVPVFYLITAGLS